MRSRLTTLVTTLRPGTPPAATLHALLAQATAVLGLPTHEESWLALAILTAELPESSAVVRLKRRAELDGTTAALAEIIRTAPRDSLRTRVEVATDEVVVDVNQLATTTLMTGIQRVAQGTVSRWHRDHLISLVRWTEGYRAIQRTNATESARAVGGDGVGREPEVNPVAVVVPWRSHYVLPEVALEVPRTSRIQALARYGRCTTAAIGFDAIPLTTAETTDTNVPAYFVRALAAFRHMDRVACISAAALAEYRGWRTMLSAIGVPGPAIAEVSLPLDAPLPSPEHVAEARDRFCEDAPLVLCVGSHEPRKNHLAVLHAAELLWREHVPFSLLFVGGNAWQSGRFERRLAELQAAGRPVRATRSVADETLWALYRLARCTVFPSFNEGFGLPVAESLASGTPAVASDIDSVREIGASGGLLLVDPRDDQAIASALETLLTDDEVHDRLTREARLIPRRTWDDYARDTWDYLVENGSTADQ
jgi:glycosyltransferase involved in cell wall biosynthesis